MSTFNLNKDTPFELSKTSNLIKKMFLGLSWNDSADVDLSAGLVDRNGRMIETISFSNARRWVANSLFHMGDDLTGSDAKTDTDNEQIEIKLDQVPANVQHIYAVATVYSGRINGAKVSIRETTNGPAVVRSCMGNKNKALVLARITRNGADWKIEQLDIPGNGSTIGSVRSIIEDHAGGRPVQAAAPAQSEGFFSRAARSLFG